MTNPLAAIYLWSLNIQNLIACDSCLAWKGSMAIASPLPAPRSRPRSTKTQRHLCVAQSVQNIWRHPAYQPSVTMPTKGSRDRSEPIPRVLPGTLKGAHKTGPVCPERICKNTRVSTGLSKLVSCWFMSFFRGLATYLNSGYNLFTKYQQDIPVYARQIWMKCDSPHTSETHHFLREDHRDPMFGRMSSSVFHQIFQDGNLQF